MDVNFYRNRGELGTLTMADVPSTTDEGIGMAATPESPLTTGASGTAPIPTPTGSATGIKMLLHDGFATLFVGVIVLLLV